MDAQSVTAAIRHRRTIKPKFFSDQPVDESLIQTMLENANWAPTHGMTEPWRFQVFIGPARKRLADFLAATYKQLTPADQFKPNKYEGMSKNAMLAQAVIVIGMQRQASEKITELDEIMAVACAVQNMHLTASAHGLGAFWSTNIAAVSDEMRQFVGLKPKDHSLGLFYLGYPAETWPTCQRAAIDDKVDWVRE
ncbi:nitroreductase family protein [Planctomycetes bacterium K23_9]|uniref:Putative NAD(P)H nitroreductase n=1 Tax=Stieleria marina TaxID=1930275 RepID=A0A517P1E4_9BACT|nr:Putative NAD(P)H nitroreductase YdjA [Planctomycetes bacterium K23_9]